jgi:hypothetical protein
MPFTMWASSAPLRRTSRQQIGVDKAVVVDAANVQQLDVNVAKANRIFDSQIWLG